MRGPRSPTESDLLKQPESLAPSGVVPISTTSAVLLGHPAIPGRPVETSSKRQPAPLPGILASLRIRSGDSSSGCHLSAFTCSGHSVADAIEDPQVQEPHCASTTNRSGVGQSIAAATYLSKTIFLTALKSPVLIPQM